MRWLGILLIVLAPALPVLAEDWTTADGKTYKNVTILAQEEDGVRITYTGGVGKIPYYELPVAIQKRLGEDPDSLEIKRKAAEKAQAEAQAEAARNAAAAAAIAAEQKKEQEETAAAEAKNHPPPKPHPSVSTLPEQAPPPQAPPRPVQQAVHPSTVVENIDLYPGSKFSYNETSDVCYLDSPVVEISPVLPEAAPAAAAQGHNTLSMRIATDGHKPEMPDQIETTFISATNFKKSVGGHDLKFLVDGTYLPVTAMEDSDADASSGATQQTTRSISFFLSPQQVHSILRGKNVNFRVGSANYLIDPAGISTFQKYLTDVDGLPPASTNLIRSYHKFLARLPSIITVISTVCEYVVLSSFAIIVTIFGAAFVLGATKFMKM